MKVCLIGPPIVTELDGTPTSRADILRRTQEPPLGILTLAALLEEMGIDLQIFDVNRLFGEMAEAEGIEPRTTFFDAVSTEIADIEADIFGFGTITGSYPLTIRLAAAASHAHPGASIIFGGPQATALDIETVEAFPFVDFIVRGEADETFPRLLETLDRSRSPAALPGITYRSSARAVRTTDASVVTDLDGLPMPAFHLWHGIEAYRYLSLEAGRGCPFSCTFCSTSTFFSRRYRMKSPSCVIGQMRRIRQAYGMDTFHLVHDTFTARRDKAIAFCEALLKSGDQFKWTCSGRTDCIDKELLKLMEKAGCTGVFFGIETGSARMQQTIGKKLDLDQAAEAIRCAESLQVKSTVSLIIGFPDETQEDLRSTINFLIDCLRFDRVTGQMYLLTPAAGSPIYDRYRRDLVWDGIFSEVTIQNWRQDCAEYALIREYPQVFPDFYAIPIPLLDRHYLVDLRDFIAYGVARFRWLIIALHQHSGNLLEVFDLWRSWGLQHPPAKTRNTEYYGSIAFPSDFLEFVGSDYPRADDADALAVTTLLEYEIGLDRLGERNDGFPRPAEAQGKPLADVRTIPSLAPGVALVHLGADYQSIIEHLKSRKSPRDVPRRPVVVAYRPSVDNSAEVLQLSPLSFSLLELCNGERTVAEIAKRFPQLQEGLDRFPKEEACLFALNELVRQRLITAAT
jgi:radical SAM superfamily enzyme YgiQ (UPF0313 family)